MGDTCYHHLTTKDGLPGILRDKKINPSQRCRGDAHFGDGVYASTASTLATPFTDIAFNNYGNSDGDRVADILIYTTIPFEHVGKKHSRDVHLLKDQSLDIDFDKTCIDVITIIPADIIWDVFTSDYSEDVSFCFARAEDPGDPKWKWKCINAVPVCTICTETISNGKDFYAMRSPSCIAHESCHAICRDCIKVYKSKDCPLCGVNATADLGVCRGRLGDYGEVYWQQDNMVALELIKRAVVHYVNENLDKAAGMIPKSAGPIPEPQNPGDGPETYLAARLRRRAATARDAQTAREEIEEQRRSILGCIKSFFGGLWEIITWPFRKLYQLLAKAWAWIKSKLSSSEPAPAPPLQV